MPLGLLDSDKIWATNGEKFIHGGGGRRREEEDLCYVVNNNGGFPEPTSVLDSIRSPSPFVSSSTTTLSSSHGGGGPTGNGGGGVGGGAGFTGKCDEMGFEDLDGVLSGSPGQEQSIFRLLMAGGGGGDVVDPVCSSGFLGFDPGSGSDPNNPMLSCFPFHEEDDEKFQISTNLDILNPNPGFFSVGSDPPLSPPYKRLNSGQPGSQHQQQLWVFPFSDPGPDPFLTQPLKLAGEDEVEDVDQSSTVFIIDQLFNLAAELTGDNHNNNPNLAQGILARLNHTLNQKVQNTNHNNPKPPFHRAASYITEALHSLSSPPSTLSPPPPQQTLILRIAAHRAFSEASPFLQFVNFTANQTILESTEGSDRVHIIDFGFDIGFGSQWASLIQELAGKRKPPSLKITAFASPSTITDEFELRFTEDNLRNFAGEIGVSLDIELLNTETLLNQSYWPPIRSDKEEAIAVNLPIGSVVSGYLPLIFRFLKQISPNVVVCSDRACDRNNDASFPNNVIHTLQYYATLLESLDSSNSEAIERFCVQPSIERLLRNRWMEKSLQPAWRSLIGQCGFVPATMSQTAETQAEYLLQRNVTTMKGFQLEKRQSSLVLCWQRKELVTVSAWKC